MLISDDYKKLNQSLHESNKHYGTSGHKWAQQILQMCKMANSQDVLDYGCGKSTLAQNLPFPIKQYDPAIEKYSQLPKPADIVVCTDVLEHIEPECVVDVLKHIANLTNKLAFLGMANGPAKKILDDGRNAHLIQENELWWLGHILPLFHLLHFSSSGIAVDTTNEGVLEYILVVSPRFKSQGESNNV